MPDSFKVLKPKTLNKSYCPIEVIDKIDVIEIPVLRELTTRKWVFNAIV